MYYIRHYSYTSKNPHLKEFLENRFGIPCKKYEHGIDQRCFSYHFDVPENHPQFREIEPYLPTPTPIIPREISNRDNDCISVLYYPEYSEQEFLEAKWLTVRSSYSKVSPEDTPNLTARTYACLARVTTRGISLMRHEVCVSGSFALKKPIKWGNRFFASANGMGEDVLFCNSNARTAMEEAGLTGVEYESVQRKSTGKEMEDIFYLKAKNILADVAIVPISDMDTYICDQCGMHMVGYRNLRGQFGIRADMINDSVDFYRTLPLFSPGLEDPSSIFGNDRFIVSQRFYQLVKERKMDRALWFEPISLVFP